MQHSSSPVQSPPSIPRPMVRTNQWVIVLSVIAAWASGFYWVMELPLVAGLLGLVTGFHPTLRFARLFLHKPMRAYAREDRDGQRFNQVIAVICLTLALAGLWFHLVWLAVLFSTLVAVAALVAILGFCIGCFIRFQWQQYRHRRKARRAGAR